MARRNWPSWHNRRVFVSVRGEPEAQLYRPAKNDDIILDLPLRHLRQRSNHRLITLGPLGRAGVLTQWAEHEPYRRARNLDLRRAALAPKVDLRTAIGGDLKHGHALRAR